MAYDDSYCLKNPTSPYCMAKVENSSRFNTSNIPTIMNPDGLMMDLGWSLYEYGTEAPFFAPGTIPAQIVGGGILDNQIEGIEKSFKTLSEATPNQITISDEYGNVRTEDRKEAPSTTDDAYFNKGNKVGGNMKGLKKITQKDRYGNMLSLEFEVPPMEEIPHPGGPKGTDTVPAWLTPGERVMNAEAERMFGPELYAMNEAGRAVQAAQGGTIPEYAAGGCKVKYAAKGSKASCNCPECSRTVYASQGQPVYAQEGIGPTDLSWWLGNEGKLLPLGLGEPEEKKVPIPETIEGGIPYPEVPTQPGTLPEASKPPEDLAVRQLLVQQEGYKTKPYKDSRGNWTVGAGHKITDSKVLERLNAGEEIEYIPDQLSNMFTQDINTATEGAKQNFKDFNNYSPELQQGLVSMNFQLGTAGTAEFKKFKAALDAGDYETAKAELDNSNWAKQTPARVEYLKSVIDKEAAQRVGNKNTITNQSGQPVVDSRFGVESTYKGQDTTPDEVPLPTETPPEVPKVSLEDRAAFYSEQIKNGKMTEEIARGALASEFPNARQGILQSLLPSQAAPTTELETSINQKADQLARIRGEEVPDRTQVVGSFPAEIAAGVTKTATSEPVIKEETPPNVQQEQKDVAEQVVTSTEAEPNPYQYGDQDDDSKEAIEFNVQQAGQQASTNPKWLNTAIDAVKGAFSNLFDEEELGRMAIMYLGSRALGYSHGGSLNFAGKSYLKRVDAKVANKQAIAQKAMGDYTSESIDKYLKTGKITDLKPIKSTEFSKDFVTFDVGGKRVNGYWDKTTQQFYARDPKGNRYAIPPNTPKWTTDTSTKDYNNWKQSAESDINSIIDNEFPAGKTPELGFPTQSEITTQAVGFFKDRGYSIKEVSTLYNMDAITQRATRSAAQYAKQNEDKKVTSIEPFLAQEILIAKVGPGFESLFIIDPNEDDINEQKFVDPVNLANVSNKLDMIATAKFEDNPAEAKAEKDRMIKKAAYVWSEMSDKQKQQYSAGKGETGFYVFLLSLTEDNKVTDEELTVKGE